MNDTGPDTGQTRWLDAQEQRTWRTYLEATQLLQRRLGQELDESGHDLSIADYELLVRLSESPDRSLRMSDLAEHLVHSRSRLTHAITRLEQRGLVERRACPEDRRGVLAVMTPAGFAALEAAAPLHVTGVREHLFDQLSGSDVEALGRICAQIAEHLR
ncbi:MarR family winged helix-turn-helix transcriptional regulator [Quadrisphaera oryzae]|uniref:MarR family winged helix-turn-helix transcriptional regulator n=1 Tax=Quadrisphaera TaxID=317661 RepID=UPI001645DC9F|nr:MarR family transcriptional regulator [Quadrisphaera sp. RL12-1S]MBC3760408.1 MarR family transcriptional regulator [Quadrisphaera sp. RL12-1S]